MLNRNLQPDWKIIEQQEWVESLRNCPQDARHHAEGDVWTHTRMVIDELLQDIDFQRLKYEEQNILFLSALFHDIAKPSCTLIENGVITSPKHAMVGEKQTRRLLWNADLHIRETIAALVRLHGLPIWTLEKYNPHRAVITSSLRLSNQALYLLSRADVRGRLCQDKEDLLFKIELFKEFCIENQCFEHTKNFHNEHSRFKFFQQDEAQYPADLYDDTLFEIIVLSGIAGSGKDTLYQKKYAHLPCISLDNIRNTYKIKATDRDAQGKVAQIAYETAKEYCRQKQSFVWNSTNLTQELRARIVRTLGVYNPRFHLIYQETSLENIFARRKNDIPKAILERMIWQLDIPLLSEGHQVTWLRN